MNDLLYGKKPWHPGRYIAAKYVSVYDGGMWQVVDDDGNRIGYFITEAQALTAAAAPIMEAALQECLDAAYYGESPADICYDVTTQCRKALAIARGCSPKDIRPTGDDDE